MHRRHTIVFISIAIPVILMTIVLTLLSINPVQTAASSTTEMTSPFKYILPQSGHVITIGMEAPISGSLDYIGWPFVNAVQLAISQTNQAGGINLGGVVYYLALETADDGCNATQAITAANTLVEDGVSVVIGPVCSSAAFATQSIYGPAGIPRILPSATNPDITLNGYTDTFRTISTEAASPRLLATHFRTWLTLPRVAIVEGLDTPGAMAGDVFSETFTSLGGEMTSRFQLTDTAQFTGALTVIQAEHADGIYYVDYSTSRAALFSKTAHNLGMDDVMIGWTSWDNFDDSILGNYASAAGEAVDNDIVALQYRRISDMPGWTTYSTDYTAAGFPNYGGDPNPMSAFAYDAANIVIDAIRRAGTASPSAIRDEIAATQNFAGVVGTYQGFDQHGDVIPQWSWIELYRDNRWFTINSSRAFLPINLK